MKRNVLSLNASVRIKDRPNGSSYKPSNNASGTTKFTAKDPTPPIDTGISCAGATTESYLLIFADMTIPPTEVPQPNPTLLLEINGREYNLTNSPSFPSEVVQEILEDVSSFVKPPSVPSNFTLVGAMKISNVDDTETKKIKVSTFQEDTSIQLNHIAVFTTFGNPTGGGYKVKDGRVVSTVCLARGTGEVTPPDPVGADVPDFAFRMSSSSASATVNDSVGNTYNGLVKSMSLAGMETRFLAKMINLPAISNLRIDAELQAVEAELTSQVLPGDYVEISVFREDVNSNTQLPYWYKSNTAQYVVTGNECETGFAMIPIYFIEGGGSFSFQPNTRYKYEAIVKRGIVGSSALVVGTGVASVIDKTMYTMDKSQYDGTNLWLSLRYASDYVASGYKGYKFALNLSNISSRLALGGAQASNIAGGVYGELYKNTGKMWSYQMSYTATSVTHKIWDSSIDQVQEVTFPTQYDLWKLYPNLVFSDDAKYVTLVHASGTSGNNTQIMIDVTFIRDATTNKYRALLEGEVADLSNSPIYANEGVYTDGSTWGNPARYYGMWSKDMSKFLKIVPSNGYTGSDPENAVREDTPSLYDLSSRQSTGRHVLVLSPSNDSFIAILKRYSIFNRTDKGMDVRFQYKIFNTGRFLLAWQVQNGASAFLFERVGDDWELNAVLVTSRLAHVAESVADYYDKVIVLENTYLMTSLGSNMLSIGNDEKFLIYGGNPDVPFVELNNNVLDYVVYDPTTKVVSKLSIGE